MISFFNPVTILPAPRSVQPKTTRPVSATTFIPKKQVHGSLEAKHDPSSTSSHPPTATPSSTNQVEDSFDGPACFAYAVSWRTHHYYRVRRVGFCPLRGSNPQRQLSSLALGINHSCTNDSGPFYSFIDSIRSRSSLFNLQRPLVLSLFDGSAVFQGPIAQSTTLDVEFPNGTNRKSDFCSPSGPSDIGHPGILVVTLT